MHDNQTESFSSPLAEAQALVRRLAEPVPAGDSTKAAISRSARSLQNWTYNRVRDVWHADARVRIRAEELEELRSHRGGRETKKGFGNGGTEFQQGLADLRAKIERLELRLESLAQAGGDGAGLGGIAGGPTV